MSDRPTRIERIAGRGWVVRTLDGRVVSPPFMFRREARLAAKRYRTSVDNLRLSNKSIRTIQP